jgi:hypothetical protein
MPTDLTVVLQDRPGELARLGEATGSAGVNILGMCAFTGEGRGIIHVLVDDPKARAARTALEDAEMGVADEREVLVVDIEDRPGTLGSLLGRWPRPTSTSSSPTRPSAGSSSSSPRTTSTAPAPPSPRRAQPAVTSRAKASNAFR